MSIVMLLMIAAGIGVALAVTDPRAVTLRWLRLGGIIAVCFVAVAMTLALMTPDAALINRLAPLAVGLPFVGQVLGAQAGKRGYQQALAALGALLGGAAVYLLLLRQAELRVDGAGIAKAIPLSTRAGLAAAAFLGSGLVGTMLMTMLLGHAYLTAGHEMTQRPFQRLVRVAGALLLARAVASTAWGLWPYLSAAGVTGRRAGPWEVAMLLSRYGVGLIVPAVFIYMTYDCVKRRANQSATGILYVACVLVLLGEGMALGLIGATGFAF